MTDEKPKPCKRLGSDSTREQRELAHIVKMGMKKKLNEHNSLQLLQHPEYVLANQSQHHENFGETPKQQTERMLSEKSS